ncbi:MAG: hypothetical protein ACRDC4_10075 [Plesiomonas sp.]
MPDNSGPPSGGLFICTIRFLRMGQSATAGSSATRAGRKMGAIRAAFAPCSASRGQGSV